MPLLGTMVFALPAMLIFFALTQSHYGLDPGQTYLPRSGLVGGE
jgi:hypothetical protein